MAEVHLNFDLLAIRVSYRVTPSLTSTFANSEDPDEMQHNAAFHQGLHCFVKVKTIFRQNTTIAVFKIII